jgi:hypothetical protein
MNRRSMANKDGGPIPGWPPGRGPNKGELEEKAIGIIAPFHGQLSTS